ncbi:MAG: thiamine pyrophosphate-binding protein [Deltaproteobacteria bacterium]|nr:thiamine pyrophosphate-binding protein [Deltaproteobacteria bacterium]
MATTAEVFARSLREAGVRRIFGLPGGEVVNLIEACRREGVEFVLTRHEATAAFMADVTGQISRRPGVCLSTLGPGATNLVSGVANAYLDRSPVLAITGDMSTEVARSCTHQQLDLNALYGPITKWSARVVGEGTAPLVRRALALTTEGRPGPAHLVLPSNVARGEERQGPGPALPPPPPEVAIAPEAVRKFVQVVGRAARPVLLLGIGVDPVRHRQAVLRLLEATGMPALVTPKAKGVIPEDHPLFAGVCSGPRPRARRCSRPGLRARPGPRPTWQRSGRR